MVTVPVILHAGFHKTASSSVQQSLAAARGHLCACGFDYAQLNNAEGDDHINHSLALFVAFSERYDQYPYLVARGLDADRERSRFRAELMAAIEGARTAGRTLILSGEEVSSLSVAALADMKDFFADADTDLRMVALVRAPYAVSCSDGQEWIKAGHQYHVTHRQSMPAITRIQTVFPKAQFHSFARACDHPSGPVGYLLQQVRIDTDQNVALLRVNESLSDQIVRLIAHINAIEPVALSGKKSAWRFRNDTRALWAIPGDRFVFSDNEFSQIEASVRAENDALRAAFGDDFCDQSFPTRSVPCAWTDAMLRQLLDVFPALPATVGILTYSYFLAGDMADSASVAKMRQCLLTPDHEARRRDLSPSLKTKAEQLGPRQQRLAETLHMLADTPFVA
ncbi:MAG: hypothetical protein AAGL18_01995 [Pseudomonadota bacterium]